MLHSVRTKYGAASYDDALNAVADVDDAGCWSLSWQSMMLQQRLGSGDAGVLCDKVRKVAVAAFAAPAECVNEGIPFQTIFIRKSSCAVSKIDCFFQLCCGEGYYVDAFL